MINKIQKKAIQLIKADAQFIYSLMKLEKRVKSNYITMAFPYIGLFADGAEQWGRKVGHSSIKFTNEEKLYYTEIRNKHKLFDYSYKDLYDKLNEQFIASDIYFNNTQSWIEKNLIGYKNLGVDYCNKNVCGNTILCGIYAPINPLKANYSGEKIRDLSIVVGKLCKIYECDDAELKFDNNLYFKFKDYNLFKGKLLLCNRSFDIFCLFSILCSINYIIYFVNRFFLNESPTKLRFAYLQYYYLFGLIREINDKLETNFLLDGTWINKDFRNCMAHYGLGQIIKEDDFDDNDIMGGITEKLFKMKYFDFKNTIYKQLENLSHQFEEYVMR